ncbi:MAG: MFS transporter, partial [Actinomycetota bacterium]
VAAGPFVGGLFVSGLGWRSLFLVALPIGALAIVTVRKQLAESSIRKTNPPMDIAGLVFLAIFLGGFVSGLQRLGHGKTAGWQILVSLVALGLFVLRESRAADPALPLSLFKQKGFSAAVVGVFGATLILHATFFLVPIFIQNLLFGSALMTGFVLLGLSAVGGAIAPFSGRFSDRVGRRTPAVAGSLSMAAGMGLLSLFSEDATLIVIAGCLCLVGIGFGLSGTPRQASALESAHASRTGMAAGIYYSSRYIGGSIGATLAGVLLAEQANRANMSRAFGVMFVASLLVAAFTLWLPGARALPALGGPGDNP